MTLFAASSQAGLPRRRWPLAVSLAVHALLIGLWVRHADLRPVVRDEPESLSVLIVPAPRLIEPEPRRVPDDKGRRRKPVQPVVPAAPGRTPPAVQEAAPLATAVQDAAPVAARPSAAEILSMARRDIGKFDREPGGGKLGGKSDDALRPAESAWDRFAERVSEAHVDQGPPVHDTYTSPDGTTYYRTRVGNKSYCRKTGTLDASSTWKTGREMHANGMSTLGVAGTAGLVLCPGSERDWKR